MADLLYVAKLKKENERLQAEVIRLSQMWLELKKFIISQEKSPHGNQVSKES